MASKRPKCANCTRPFTPDAIGKTRAVSSFCTLACGAEFAERILRTEPAVVKLLLPEDPLATRLTLATGCGKLAWSHKDLCYYACPHGKGCEGPHRPPVGT